MTIIAAIAGMGCASLPAVSQIGPDKASLSDTGLALQSDALIVAPVPAPLQASVEAQQIIQKIGGDPDYCINKMAGFPSDNHEARYQFFKLTQEMNAGVTPQYRSALEQYGDGAPAADTPMLDVIEDIANPVLRQAAPQITIATMNYVIDFSSICAPFITGQIDSLTAFDPGLGDVDFNSVITEDALFLRQILSQSMLRLGADQDPIYGAAVLQYADGLITARDDMEFVSFESELGDLEALYMNDLDGRLKRSNDMINEEVDREVLGDSVALSDSMNEAAEKQAKERQLRTLVQILGGGG